jgi:metal-responsive CopG/Arc/MetJ family transcriptional regulator
VTKVHLEESLVDFAAKGSKGRASEAVGAPIPTYVGRDANSSMIRGMAVAMIVMSMKRRQTRVMAKSTDYREKPKMPSGSV